MRQLTGWTISILFGALGVSLPGTTMAEISVLPSQQSVLVVTPDRVEGTRTKSVLLDVYSFGEKSQRVKKLQTEIGTVRIDGEYGSITRREHVEKLQELNLPISNVPTLPAPPTGSGYDIPSDLSKRCPQWIPLFQEYGLEPVEVFSYIAWRESGCSPQAQNATWDKNGNMTYHLNKDKSYDTGLLQINSSWFSVTKLVCGKDSVDGRMAGLKDPVCNVRVAKYIMDNSKGKLGNWRVYKN